MKYFIAALYFLIQVTVAKAQTSTQARTPTHTPTTPPTSTLAFDEALRVAANKSETLQIERTNVNAAQHTERAAKFNFLPSLSANASQQKTGDPSIDTKTYSLVADFNLYSGGSDSASLSAARENLTAARANLQNTELTFESTAVAGLLLYIQREEETKILTDNLNNQTHYLEIAERKYKNGTLALEQLDKIRIDRANSEATLRDTEIERTRAREGLRNLIGPAQSVQAAWPWRNKLSDRNWTNEILKKISKIENQNRPDYKAAAARYSESHHKTRATQGQILPSLDFRYSLTEQHIEDTRDSGWSALLTLSMPLFEGLQDYSSYQVQKQNELAESLRFQRLKKEIDSEREASSKSFLTSIDTALAREKNLEAASRLLKSSQRRFEIGRTQADELNLDQQRVIDAELLVTRGWAEVHSAFVRLVHSAGYSITKIN